MNEQELDPTYKKYLTEYMAQLGLSHPDKGFETEYKRVLPRSFFNESKLLLCLGKLSLLIEDGDTAELGLTHEFDGQPFIVAEDEGSGDLSVINYKVFVKKNGVNQQILLYNPLNSRDKFPLFANWDEEDYEVFDDDGKLSSDFINGLKKLIAKS